MSYLIDTNTLIYAKDRKHAHVIERFAQVPLADLLVSAVTVAELEYGAAKSRQPALSRAVLSRYLLPYTILPFTDDDAEVLGAIRAELERKGQPIGPYDMMIAAQAVAHDLVLVTSNTSEFDRVPRLVCVDWAREMSK